MNNLEMYSIKLDEIIKRKIARKVIRWFCTDLSWMKVDWEEKKKQGIYKDFEDYALDIFMKEEL
jgi:hypothetical protein